jgi:hypothetical protein
MDDCRDVIIEDVISLMEDDNEVWVLHYTPPPPQRPQPKKKSPLDEKLEKLIKESDVMFNYMIEQYETIFNDNTIRCFEITSGTEHITCEDDLNNNCGIEIQRELIQWIEHERQKGDLFNKINWRPFYYYCYSDYMYLGYNKFFKYKNYYFKLALEEGYMETKYIFKDNKYPVCFGLILHGWKDPDHEMLQPENRAIPASDDIIPYYYWNKDVVK